MARLANTKAVTATASDFLGANVARQGLTVRNAGDGNVYFAFGENAVAGEGFYLEANESAFLSPCALLRKRISVVCDTAETATLNYQDGLVGGAAFPSTVTLEATDIEIGAVELKDADTDVRANIKAANTARTAATVVVATQSVDAAGEVLTQSTQAAIAAAAGTTTDAKADVDGNGTIESHLRRVAFEADRIGDTAGAAADAKADVDGNGTVIAHLRRVGFEADRIGDKTDNIPALGAAAAAAAVPVTLATEDAAKVPSLGSAADAASVPVTMSTEDKAKVPALGAAAAVASTPVTLATEDAAKVPALGQAIEAASVPCVLTAAQETALKAVTEASAADILTALQLIDDAYDPLALSLRTLPVGEALDPGLEAYPTALTAAGSTAALNVQGRAKINWQYVVSSLDTTVVVRVEGSHDGTNWYNLDADRNDTTEVADGTYCLYCAAAACKYTRFTFVSETGGTAVVVTPKLYAIK